MLTAKTLIRLGKCPGWSESSLGAHATLFVLSCCGSNILSFTKTWNWNLHKKYDEFYTNLNWLEEKFVIVDNYENVFVINERHIQQIFIIYTGLYLKTLFNGSALTAKPILSIAIHHYATCGLYKQQLKFGFSKKSIIKIPFQLKSFTKFTVLQSWQIYFPCECSQL